MAYKVFGTDTLKAWVTRRDSKVRGPHREADDLTGITAFNMIATGF